MIFINDICFMILGAVAVLIGKIISDDALWIVGMVYMGIAGHSLIAKIIEKSK